MKNLVASGAILFLSSAFLVGCGDENTTEITQVVGMQVVEAGESMPKCTADNEGAMVYSVDSAEAYYCVNRKWVSMKGEKGEDGKKGADGKNGAAGADGKDGSSCTAKALKNGKGYKVVCGGDSVGVVLNGEKGDPGVKGDSGVAGTSCSAEEVAGGVKITCTDGKTYTLSNGADGKDGRNFEEGWMVDHRDYHIYKIVTIGTETWMAENLNYETETGSFCYNDNAKYCEKYGRLYTWATAVGKSEDDCGYGNSCNLGTGKVRGVCPEGWHLPESAKLLPLFYTFGMDELKSTEGWNDYEGTSGNGWDSYSFSAMPAGYRDDSGDYYDEGGGAYFWSSTESYSTYGAYSMYMGCGYGDTSVDYKNYGFSVRCLKD